MISQYDYQYDAVGRRETVANSGTAFAASAFNLYGYDDRNQLTESSRYVGADIADTSDPVPAEHRAYSYDPIGNRTDITEAADSGTYTSNALNQYTEHAVPGGGTNSFAYDLDGNLISATSAGSARNLIYNAENRLISVAPQTPVEGDKKLEFVYDFMGRRVKKGVYTYATDTWHLSSDVLFIYDGWNLIYQTTDDGQQTTDKYFVWGLDLSQSLQGAGGIGGLLASVEGTSTHYFMYDANGNVGQLVNAADGTIAAKYEYDPYGNAIVAEGTEAQNNPYRFSTKYTDDETGLVYYGYRYYSPQLGRWLNRDPLSETGGLNSYGFVENNPYNKVDTLGLTSRSDIRNGILQYSCNCGWIDWNHAHPSAAWSLWSGPYSIQTNKGWAKSRTGKGFEVCYAQTMGKWGIEAYYSRQYFVKFDLPPGEQKSVALAIFMEVSEGFEEMQASFPFNLATRSGFSEEDLVSDLIGFYMNVEGYTRGEIQAPDMCNVVSADEAEKVWDATGGLGKSREWKPVDHNKETSCCPDKMEFPAKLGAIKPAPKGELWRDWIRGIDEPM